MKKIKDWWNKLDPLTEFVFCKQYLAAEQFHKNTAPHRLLRSALRAKCFTWEKTYKWTLLMGLLNCLAIIDIYENRINFGAVYSLTILVCLALHCKFLSLRHALLLADLPVKFTPGLRVIDYTTLVITSTMQGFIISVMSLIAYLWYIFSKDTEYSLATWYYTGAIVLFLAVTWLLYKYHKVCKRLRKEAEDPYFWFPQELDADGK